jgi:hypothetical protein
MWPSLPKMRCVFWEVSYRSLWSDAPHVFFRSNDKSLQKMGQNGSRFGVLCNDGGLACWANWESVERDLSTRFGLRRRTGAEKRRMESLPQPIRRWGASAGVAASSPDNPTASKRAKQQWVMSLPEHVPLQEKGIPGEGLGTVWCHIAAARQG